MRLRLPSRASSWREDGGEAGGEQEGDRNQGDQLAVPGRASLSDPLALFDVFDQGDGVGARAQVVAGDRVAAPGRQRVGLDRARVALFVEVDPEGQLVGEAAVERDPAAVVGAEEPDLAVAVPGAEGDRGDQDQRRRGPWPRSAAAAASRLLVGAFAALLGGRGGGAAADLGRGQARLLGRRPISVAPSRGPRPARRRLRAGRRAR